MTKHKSSAAAMLTTRIDMFSAICIQESWLKQGQDISLFQIPGYNLINQPKVCSEHGGLIIYLKREYTHNVRDLHKSSDILEGLFIDVFHENTNKKITIGNIYRPPKNNNSNPTIENFIQQINPIISNLSKENSHAIFTGDFNINLLEMNTRIMYQAYFDQFVTNGFYPKIVQPCRFTKKTGSVIDHTFCKLSENTSKSHSGILISNMSDHLPHFTCLDILSNQQKPPKYIIKEKHDEASLLSFYNEIESSLRNTHFPNELTTDPNVTYNLLEKIIVSAKEKHLKPVKTKLNHYKHKKNPWISMGIINSIKFRDKMYKRLRLTNCDSPMYETLEKTLKNYNCILQRNINAAKKNYYESKFNRYVSNIKQTWTTINELLNKCINKKEFPSYFIINGDKIDNKEDIANNFNSFFQNIGPTLSANIPQHKNITIKTFLKEKIAFSFEFSLLEQETVFKIISKINSKHSCGHDDISTILMKNICPLILSPITLILNQSLSTGIFPDRLKIAKIIPLFKKEDPHQLDNYRPISLLPAFSKIFEKAVFIQLYEYFNKNNLLYKSQYGFRTLHSTELASLEIIDIIGKDLDNGKLPIGVFLDLSKAFDTLDHTILLDKLLYYGIKGTELAWFKSYLTDRTQFVSYNGTNSRTLTITTGVPQGSILGPLLFIIYMNDIHNASSKFHAILFADDTNLTSTLCSFDVNIDNNCNSLQLSTNINKELKNIQIWLEINKLSLNVKKTKFMIFHHKQRNIENLIPQLNLNEQIIERVTDFDFLGLTIDQHLTWNGHVQKISNKISRSLGIMCKLKRFLPQNILKILYNSLILPHLQYCILSWGFKSDRIFKLQKRAARIITCSKYNAHTEPLLKTLNLLKIEDIMKTKALKLYYRYKQNELPKYFESMFTESNDNHSHDTRHKSLLYQLPTKTSTGRLCIRHYIPELLSKTPECITEKLDTHSFSGFSNYMKNYYIRNYNENCLVENCYFCQK